MSWIAQIISIACIIFLANCAETHGDDRAGPKDSRGHYSVRRLDCSLFCKKTGFSGYVGGCQCGFTLFANKRSDANNIDTNGFFGTKLKANKLARIGLKSSYGFGSNRQSNEDQSKYGYALNSRPIYGHL